MRSFLLFSFFLFLFSQFSCKKYAPAPEAFFLKPGVITVNTNSIQGSGSHKITDLWVYVNGKFQGAYPVENKIPIVTNNSKVKITVLAGIKNNGIAGTRISWPLYSNIQFDTLVESGTTATRPFTFSYFPAATFTWTENFESSTVGGYTIEKSLASSVKPVIRSDEGGIEGKYMELKLLGDSVVAQAQSSGSGFTLPKASSNVYLEFNYKCNHEFNLGLIAENTQLKPVIFLKEQPQWNKIYVQLSALINTEPVSDKYKIYFQMIRANTDPTAYLHIDNIKLVYLP